LLVDEGREFRFRGDLYSQESTFPLVIIIIIIICLERGADLHMAQLMPLPLIVSCFSKIQIDFTFLVPAHLGIPGKGPLNGCCRRRRRRRCCCCCCCLELNSNDYITRFMDF